MYNEYLKNERVQISKHFLKRKIKSAFEREPLDKCKGFFNVPFIPSMNMFTTTTNNTSQQSSNPIPANNLQNNNTYASAQNGKNYLKLDKKIPLNQNVNIPTQKMPITSNMPVNNISRVSSTPAPVDNKPIIKIETPTNLQKKNEIFSTSYRERSIPENSSVNSIHYQTIPQSHINSMEEKKIEKEIKQEFNPRISIPISSINQNYTQPMNSTISQNQNLQQNSSLTNNATNMLINKINNSAQNQDIINILKETGISLDHIESFKKTGILQHNLGNNLLRQQMPQSSYNKNNYHITNTPNDIEPNCSSLSQSYYLDNQQIKNNKIINSNMINMNSINFIRGIPQILQNLAKVNSVNNIGSNFNANTVNFKNEMVNSSLEQDLNSQQNSQNINLMPNYRNSQYINKPIATGLYSQANQLVKNGYSIGNNQQNNVQTNSQPNLSADDVLNSFNVSNHYD